MSPKTWLTVGTIACSVGGVVCEAAKSVIDHKETVSEVTQEVLKNLEKK